MKRQCLLAQMLALVEGAEHPLTAKQIHACLDGFALASVQHTLSCESRLFNVDRRRQPHLYSRRTAAESERAINDRLVADSIGADVRVDPSLPRFDSHALLHRLGEHVRRPRHRDRTAA